MSSHILRWARSRTALSALVLVLTLGTLAVIAFASKGYPAAKVTLNDGSVWVTDGDIGALGRFNKPIEQLDSYLVASKSTAPDIDVLQDADTVLSVDRGTGELRLVNVANVALSDDGAQLPASAVVALGGGVAAFADAVSGRLWARPVKAITGVTAMAKPTVTVGADAAVAVGTDGTVYAVSAATGLLVEIDGVAAGHPAIEHRSVGVTGSGAQIATVGTQPVILIGDRVILPGNRTVSLPAAQAPGALLQQSGAANGTVYVASNTALFAIDVKTGGLTTLYAHGGGGPAAPVAVAGCVYAAWAGEATFLRQCGDSAPQAPRMLTGLPANPRLTFRVNRDVVVLNEISVGRVYIYSRGGQDLGNWTALKPKELPTPKPGPSNKVSGKSNRDPSAVDDNLNARAGLTSTLHVLDNDGDPDRDILVISSVANLPAGAGRVAIVDNGQAVQFSADPSWSGSASFRYTINDGRGGTASATVHLSPRVAGQNQAPTAPAAQSRITLAASGKTSQNVLTAWRDPDSDPLTLANATVPSPDSLVFTPDGRITLTDAGGNHHGAVVSIVVSDGHATTTATVAVTVVAVGHGSITANDDRITGVAGQAIAIKPLDNDTDPNTTAGDSDYRLRISQVSDGPNGTIVTPAFQDDAIRFRATRTGSYYLSYQTTDGGTATAKAVIRVDVVAPSTANPPIAVADQATLRGATPTQIDVLANDIDPSGDVLMVGAVAVPDNAGLSVSVIGHRWLRIVETTAGSGTVTIHYTVTDGGGSDTGAVTVTELAAVTDAPPPTPRDDRATVRVGDVATIDAIGNDSDPQGEQLTLDAIHPTDPSSRFGTWHVSGQTIRFLASKAGTASAYYEVVNTDGTPATAEITVTVNAAGTTTTDQPPAPLTVAARVFAGVTVRIPIPLDDVDPDGDSVVLVGPASVPHLGRIVAQGPGYLTYQAYAGSTGTDSFSYILQDTFGEHATGTIRVGITARPAEDSAPTAVDDIYTVAPGTIVRVPVLANDSDVDGDPLTVEPLSQVNASLPAGTRLDGDVITIKAGTGGKPVSVRYSITDGRGRRSTASVTINNQPNADVAPVAVDDLAPDPAAGATTVLVPVLANDYDVDAGSAGVTVHALDSGALASQVVGSKLLVRLSPLPRRVAYEISDGTLNAVAFVQVPGTAARLPYANPKAPSLQVAAGGRLVVPLAAEIIDPAGLPVRLTSAAGIATSPVPGLSLSTASSTTSFTLNAAASYSGPASIVLNVTDAPVATGADKVSDPSRTTSITLSVTVVPPASAKPVFSCPAVRPQAAQPALTIDLAPCVTGISIHAASRLSFSAPSGVPAGVSASIKGTTLKLSADQHAKPNVAGTLRFTVTDADGRSAPATIGIVVAAAPLPQARPDAVTGVHAGATISVPVLANDFNPFPGTQLTVVKALVAGGGVTVGSVSASAVTIHANANFFGRTSVTYWIEDATKDPSRQASGQITIDVVGKPGAPGTPHLASVGDSVAVISWGPAVSNGEPITDYTVTGHSSKGTYQHDCQNSTLCTLTGLENGVTYSFTVTATNDVGVGPASPALASVEPDTKPDQPNSPSTTFGNTAITVTWAPPSNRGSKIVSYELQISPQVSGGVMAVTGTTYTWTGLTNGVSYTFRVRAVNETGKKSDWSTFSAGQTPAGPPLQPTAPTATALNFGVGKQMSVVWQRPPTNGAIITAYHLTVFRAGVNVGTIATAGDTSSATVDVDNGITYTFQVTATNKAGTSVASPSSAPIQAHGKPDQVAVFSVSDHNGTAGLNGRISYSLTAPGDNGLAISRYEFNYTGGDNVDATGNGTSGTIDNLSNGTSYSVKVRACNDSCGDWSNVASPAIPYGPVNTPGANAVQSGARQVTLSWSAPPTNGRSISRVEISINGGGWADAGSLSGSRNYGDGPNQTFSIVARAFDSAGQVSGNSPTYQASTQPPSVSVSHGAATSLCNAPCYFVVITLTNFPSNAGYTCTFDSQEGGGFTNASGTTDGNGNASKQTIDYFGYTHSWISATCNGTTGTNTNW